jgi:hypothetical protein
LTAIQFRAEPGTILTRRFEQRLTLADSGLQLDPEIALGGIPTKDQPHGLLQLGQRGVETSGDVIDHSFASPTKICQALLFGSGHTLVLKRMFWVARKRVTEIRLGIAALRRRDFF